MDLAALAGALRAEAERTDERRGIVLAGDRESGYAAARSAIEAADVPWAETTLVGPDGAGASALPCERVAIRRAGELLGTTRTAVVVDAHGELRPNAIGQVVGCVDGGGLLIVLAPSLDCWPDVRDDFDRGLAVPPFGLADVTGRFRSRLVRTLRAHRGVAVVGVDGRGEPGGSEFEIRVEDDGLTDPAPRIRDPEPVRPPDDHAFPEAAYRRCLTADQAAALAALERLTDPGSAVVVEADRGRGKSSAAGLAAGALAAAGEDVLVTAPGFRSAAELFERAGEVLADADGGSRASAASAGDPPRRIDAAGGGRIRYLSPAEAAATLSEGPREGGDGVAGRDGGAGRDAPDVLIVDEAAALPVSVLVGLLEADRIALATTIHGYEGAGRGFSVRFRDELADAPHDVTEVGLDEPIRHAAGDPLEVWAFDALLLDARPAVDPLVEDATPRTTAYRRLSPDELLGDEPLLREVFGLLVLAHYRTEPDDLARLLDAPNLAVRALLYEGNVVSVALLAREGGLDADLRAEMYDGARVRGNMLPDVLTSQLRDEAAARPVGLRVVRIATHPAARSRGLGSRLLDRVRSEARDGLEEFRGVRAGDDGRDVPDSGDAPPPAASGRDAPPSGDEPSDAGDPAVDWLGVGYGATPDLLRFWRENGYRTVHLSTTRNERSGEYSALMIDPLSATGSDLHDRTARRFARRIPAVLGDALDDADPDVVRAALRAVDPDAVLPVGLTDWEWEVVAGAAYGPGLFDVAPRPFRRLAVGYLADDPGVDTSPVTASGDRAGSNDRLSARQERLLVRRVLQAWDWPAVAEELQYSSAGQCMRALGEALEPIVDRYGTETARAVRERYADRR